jgi:site-specific DNA-methyltransferase (adenine-specific)
MVMKILNCDILEGFKTLEDKSIDLIVTSPPYNVGIEYDTWNDLMSKEEYFVWVDEWLSECFRVLKDDGRIAINVPFEVNMKQNSEKGEGRVFISSEYWQHMMSVGFKFFGVVRLQEIATQRVKFTAWGSYLSPSCPYIHNAEECVILAYKNNYKREVKGETDLTKEEFVEYVSGLWGYRAETRGLTMANFSLDIPMKAIKIFTYIGETVLDPFTGSGTTGVAAIKLKRDFIGFEISPNYYKIAMDRVQHAVDKTNCALTDMFGG